VQDVDDVLPRLETFDMDVSGGWIAAERREARERHARLVQSTATAGEDPEAAQRQSDPAAQRQQRRMQRLEEQWDRAARSTTHGVRDASTDKLPAPLEAMSLGFGRPSTVATVDAALVRAMSGQTADVASRAASLDRVLSRPAARRVAQLAGVSGGREDPDGGEEDEDEGKERTGRRRGGSSGDRQGVL
jgi:hypothetical protein